MRAKQTHHNPRGIYTLACYMPINSGYKLTTKSGETLAFNQSPADRAIVAQTLATLLEQALTHVGTHGLRLLIEEVE